MIFTVVLSGEFGDIKVLFYSLKVVFYPSFWLIGMFLLMIFTLLYDEMDELEGYESDLNVYEIQLMGPTILRMIFQPQGYNIYHINGKIRMIFTLLNNEIHPKWMNWRRMKCLKMFMKVS